MNQGHWGQAFSDIPSFILGNQMLRAEHSFLFIVKREPGAPSVIFLGRPQGCHQTAQLRPSVRSRERKAEPHRELGPRQPLEGRDGRSWP